jgi:butyryl-CoA dehydrogenase
MADLADIIMQVYGLESALLRARKLAVSGKGSAEAAAAMTGLLADETIALAEQASRRVLAACGEGDLLRTQLAILRRLARFTPADAVGLSRTVARHCIQLERYPL